MSNDKIDSRVYRLYDDYCHGYISRRDFFNKASKLTVGGVTALAMAEALLPDYVAAQMISFTDERIKANYVTYPSPGGNSGEMRGYLVQPVGEGPFKPVLVMHENRGLNPHIEDVARRFAAEGFLALAPDGLAPVGGNPGNDDDSRAMQRELDGDKLLQDMVNSAEYLSNHELAGDKLGVTGFCWGGYATNFLAATMGDKVAGGVPFYGRGVDDELATRIQAELMVQDGGNDERINAGWPDYEARLKANGVVYERHLYEGAEHGFHNNSTPRYHEEAAKLAWQRTTEFFDRVLS